MAKIVFDAYAWIEYLAGTEKEGTPLSHGSLYMHHLKEYAGLYEADECI